MEYSEGHHQQVETKPTREAATRPKATLNEVQEHLITLHVTTVSHILSHIWAMG